ncbi:hypothetical protein CROQUDRAFT_663728 [Cronartium quercuum f. sp. fusiforme G11]|uniref:Nucleoporin p58/p45 n=1 Tax=Cronartium quercuum f. sp. fusiforme G11 TaxID=708437 RepID=A0A9P6ND05_9BASI|nr:hypothetical protein CROQUDRAFT_663728 [Cronartium quercuum f. sp. fusiforme G11]
MSLFTQQQSSAPKTSIFSSTSTNSPGGLFSPQATLQTSSPANLFAPPATPKPSLFGATAPASAPSGGLFGNNAASGTPQTGGLFGSGSSAQPATGGLFGSSTTPATGSLFGSSNTPQTQPQQATGGLFGSTTTPATGSLFGSTNQSQSQPQQTTAGLFGSSTPQPQQQQQQTTGGLFGSSISQPTQATGSGGLFGSTSTPTATGTSGGLFGSSTTPSQQPSGGLFGSSNTQPTGGLFGNSSVGGTNNNSLFGPKPVTATTNQQSLFGASTNTVTNSNVASTSGTLLRTTRFNDLPDDVKRQLESLDGMIQNQCRLADTIKATELGREINDGTILLRQLKTDMHSTSALVDESATSLERLRKSVDSDVADVLRLGTGTGLAKFQLDYFLRMTAKLEDRMKDYEQTLEFVEIQLKGLADRPNPAAIVPAIKAQYGTFMVLADRVAALVERLRLLKEGFREIWRHQTGSVQDPFGGSIEGA